MNFFMPFTFGQIFICFVLFFSLFFLLQLYRFFMFLFKLKKKITYNLFAHCIVKDLFSNIRNFIVFIQSNLHVLNDDDAVRSEGVQCTPKIVCNLQRNAQRKHVCGQIVSEWTTKQIIYCNQYCNMNILFSRFTFSAAPWIYVRRATDHMNCSV